jgi:hypothetical protein
MTPQTANMSLWAADAVPIAVERIAVERMSVEQTAVEQMASSN